MTLETFQQLPETVQEEAREVLKAYDECYISYEYGKYHVGPGVGIKSKYAADHKHYGKIKAEQVYTVEQRRENYKETFGYYPYYL